MQQKKKRKRKIKSKIKINEKKKEEPNRRQEKKIKIECLLFWLRNEMINYEMEAFIYEKQTENISGFISFMCQ